MMGQVDRVTIYRALDRLVLEGRIHKITGLECSVQYALCHDCDVKTEHHHDHLHFHCSGCQRVVCIENVSPQFSLPAGYQIQETQFMIRGICPNCSQSSEKTASVAPEVT